MGRLIALVAALLLGLAIGLATERTPDPRPITAPATEFSADRAMRDVEAIAPVAHPVGSPENARVRDYLIGRMAALGLSPQVRPGVGVQYAKWDADSLSGAQVDNLVGILPGRDPSLPALVLMAHYDSVAGSPGAADDASGTAAILEVVRAIRARGQPPARDIMVLITDGEEAGLLGANHFFRRDPLAKRAGLVINLETRGGAGRAQMFQTSPENGPLIDLFRRSAVRPSSSSLAVYIYEQLPNDTDLTETLAAKTPGLNYAFIGEQFDYHSATSTPANLSRGSLQDIGQQVLGSATAAAFAPDLPPRGESAVYSQVFGDVVVAYPAWGGWVILAVTAVLIVIGVIRGRRVEAFPWTDALRGAGALLFAIASCVAVLGFARAATGAGAGFMEQRFLLAQAARWETAVMLVGLGVLLMAAAELARGRRIVVLLPLLAGAGASVFIGELDKLSLGAGVVATLLGLAALGRPVSRSGAWTGVLVTGLVAAAATQAAAPAAALVIAWPLAIAALMCAATDAATRRGVAGHALTAVLAGVALGWIAGLAHGSFESMDLMPLMGMPLLLAALVIWPLAQPADGAPPGRWAGAILLIAGLVVTAWVRFADPYTPRHPQATVVAYLTDLDTRKSHVVSLTPGLPAWSHGVLDAYGDHGPFRHWVWSRTVEGVPAPFVEEAPPALSLTRMADGQLSLHLGPPPGGRTITARLTPDRPLTLVSVSGVAQSATLPAGKATTVRWAGPQGVDVVFAAPAGGSVTVRASSTLDRWPAGAKPLPPRAANVMPWDVSDGTFVAVTRRFTW